MAMEIDRWIKDEAYSTAGIGLEESRRRHIEESLISAYNKGKEKRMEASEIRPGLIIVNNRLSSIEDDIRKVVISIATVRARLNEIIGHIDEDEEVQEAYEGPMEPPTPADDPRPCLDCGGAGEILNVGKCRTCGGKGKRWV